MRIIELKGVNKSFGNLRVLKGVNFYVDKGEIVVVLGPSGAGKSTMLRIINFIEPPDEGEVIFLGKELKRDMKLLRWARSKIGFVFQHFNLFRHLTALDNVAIGLVKVKGIDRKEAREIAYNYLKMVNLEDKAYNYPSQLSGGQKQRVAIARALAMEPELILFDEPTSALDPSLVGEVLVVMKELAYNGTTMVVVTHEMGFAKSVASRIVYMEDGQILENTTPEQFFANPQSQKAKDFISKIIEARVAV